MALAKYGVASGQLLETETWLVILVLSILVSIILAGLLIIYLYSQKLIQLYRLQQNFINGFTHELKTPIASLQLFLDTFTKHKLSHDDMARYLEFMRKDTERLSHNVERILNLSKLEDKKYRTNLVTVEMNHFIQQLVQSVEHQYEDMKIEVEKSHDEIELVIDRGLIEMAINNLLSNASLYNLSTEKKVKIQILKQSKKVNVLVTDNGIGIEKKDLKKILKKFYQVGTSAKGSGLGLYIVSLIMKIHNGEIKVESEGAGKGSTFKLIFGN